MVTDLFTKRIYYLQGSLQKGDAVSMANAAEQNGTAALFGVNILEINILISCTHFVVVNHLQNSSKSLW
ncbi:hypothetical protein U9M48_010058 [Paspalum notatum var. saurae]|uniref:Uncharacterized protein n=1 Tax=Paspalum notatum var. saurae TaxID=547442 RepID=A0AAQ3WFP9_PASNO